MLVQEALWNELMTKYYDNSIPESEKRDIRLITCDIEHYTINKVKQSFYSELCGGKKVREWRRKLNVLFIFEIMVTCFENHDRDLFMLMFRQPKLWLKAKYIELQYTEE